MDGALVVDDGLGALAEAELFGLEVLDEAELADVLFDVVEFVADALGGVAVEDVELLEDVEVLDAHARDDLAEDALELRLGVVVLDREVEGADVLEDFGALLGGRLELLEGVVPLELA